MLYLKENVLLRKKLEFSHFKDKILGHWGACPGVNAIFAHVSDLARRTNREIRLIVGTGHAGPSILSCTYLDGTLGDNYSNMPYGEQGICQLFTAYASNTGFSTEIQPNYPGTLYVGGELGAALAFSQGYAMKNPNSFTVCVLGDGELETSITQASWQGFGFLSSKYDGKVLPVINSNGYKMGSKSLFALMSRDEKGLLLRGHGMSPIFVGTNHVEIAVAFDTAYSQMEYDAQYHPVIVLENPKGWTAPSNFNDIPFENSRNAHKPILKNPSKKEKELRMVEDWLLSYRPIELFDSSGNPNPIVTECLPPVNIRLGNAHLAKKTNDIPLRYAPKIANNNMVLALSECLCELVSSHRFLILSPDEIDSNRFGQLASVFHLKNGNLTNCSYDAQSPLIEILNEHLCFAWAQGFARNNGIPVIISYEAFAPIFFSLSEQYLKSLNALDRVGWQSANPSINIILTSLGWYNTPTHHNPSFVDSLIGRKHPHVKIYMPIFAETAISMLNEMVNSKNRLNIIVLNKHTLPALESGRCCFCDKTRKAWTEISATSSEKVDITLVSIGDCMAEQALLAYGLIHIHTHNYSVRIIAIEDLSLLDSNWHPDLEGFKNKLRNSFCSLWLYNGFPKTIKSCLWDLGIINTVSVLGYMDMDQSSAGDERFAINRTDAKSIADEALKLLHNMNTKKGIKL